MNPSIIFILMLMVMTAITVMISRQKHLLMTLLSLEALMLSTVTIVPIIMNTSYMYMNILSIVLLTFGACEASLGLSLMVIMSRSFGSDLMSLLTINKC